MIWHQISKAAFIFSLFWIFEYSNLYPKFLNPINHQLWRRFARASVIHPLPKAFQLVQSNVQFCKICESFDQLSNSSPALRTVRQISPGHYSHPPDRQFFCTWFFLQPWSSEGSLVDSGCSSCRPVSQLHVAQLLLRILHLLQIKTSSSGVLLTSLSVLLSGDPNFEMSSSMSTTCRVGRLHRVSFYH